MILSHTYTSSGFPPSTVLRFVCVRPQVLPIERDLCYVSRTNKNLTIIPSEKRNTLEVSSSSLGEVLWFAEMSGVLWKLSNT